MYPTMEQLKEELAEAQNKAAQIKETEQKTGVLPRVEITSYMLGLCYMQVCAVADATDEEILKECNSRNPSGTTHGWCVVIRTLEQTYKANEKMLPGPCADYKGRIHYLISC